MRTPATVSISPPVQIWTHDLFGDEVHIIGPFLAVGMTQVWRGDGEDGEWEWGEVLTIGAGSERLIIPVDEVSLCVSDAIEVAREYADSVARYRSKNGIPCDGITVVPPAPSISLPASVTESGLREFVKFEQALDSPA